MSARIHLLLAFSLLSVAACSLFEQRPRTNAEESGESQDAQSESLPTTGDDGFIDVGPAPKPIQAPAPPALPEPAADAGAGPTKINPWTNAVPYSLLTPAEESSDHHLGSKHLGDDCMSCHTGAGAPRFALAGTVFTTSAGTTGAPRVQVRVVSPEGEELALVGTDSNGNFWLKDAPELPVGSWVGVRDESTARAMQATIGGGQAACNQSGCHSTTRPLHLRD